MYSNNKNEGEEEKGKEVVYFSWSIYNNQLKESPPIFPASKFHQLHSGIISQPKTQFNLFSKVDALLHLLSKKTQTNNVIGGYNINLVMIQLKWIQGIDYEWLPTTVRSIRPSFSSFPSAQSSRWRQRMSCAKDQELYVKLCSWLKLSEGISFVRIKKNTNFSFILCI